MRGKEYGQDQFLLLLLVLSGVLFAGVELQRIIGIELYIFVNAGIDCSSSFLGNSALIDFEVQIGVDVDEQPDQCSRSEFDGVIC